MGPLGLGPQARDYVDSNSVSALYANPTVLASALSQLRVKMKRSAILCRKLGLWGMRAPESFSWGLLEPDSGVYRWEMSDTIVTHAQAQGIQVLGTLIPFNDFAQACHPDTSSCANLFTGQALYFINNTRVGKICDADTATYRNFLTAMVERYDGDGIADMPGLTLPIKYWEFCNEPESHCSYNDSAEYQLDLALTASVIRNACPSCKILNGGHLTNDSLWWNHVIDFGVQDFDIANIHVNVYKTAPINFQNPFKGAFDLFENRILQNGQNYPTWVTEWGLYSNDPDSLTFRSEETQAALYAKFYAWGLANDIDNWVFDYHGRDNTGIGSAGFFEDATTPWHLRLMGYTLKLYEYKFRTIDSASIQLFSQDANLSAGHIKIWKAGHRADMLWGVSNLPGDISGTKLITDIYGNESLANTNTLVLPLSSNPILIEDSSLAMTLNPYGDFRVSLFPNPVTDVLFVDAVYPFSSPAFLQIFDLKGQEVQSFLAQPIHGFLHAQIKMDELQAGLYLFALNGRICGRIIK